LTCDDLRRDAAGIAALAPGDPEREAAYAHARTCSGCAAALREAERLVALIDALPPEAAPSEAALRRAAAPVLAALPPVRPSLALPAVTAVASAFAVIAARSASGAARDWIAAAALAAAAVGLAALSPRFASAAVALAAVGVSVAGALAGGGAGTLAAHEGVRCAGVEIAAATITFIAALALTRGGGDERGWRLAGAAAAGALAGQAALEVTCGARDSTAHLFVFHVGAVALCAVVAALAARATSAAPTASRERARR
jgi:hypothetical protein